MRLYILKLWFSTFPCLYTVLLMAFVYHFVHNSSCSSEKCFAKFYSNQLTSVNLSVYLIKHFFVSASSPPINVIVSSVNATAVNVAWEEPVVHNGIIRSYIIVIVIDNNAIILTVISHNDTAVLRTTIYGLTHNTNYIVNISAVTVEPGDAASLSFTTPSCKYVIVLMCYLMYCFD